MKKLFLIFLLLVGGCFASFTPDYTTKHGFFVLDQADVSQKQIEAATDITVYSLGGVHGLEHDDMRRVIKGLNIQVYNVPICVPTKDGFTVADGYSANSTIVVSTVRGCHDAIAHELGHFIQARLLGRVDRHEGNDDKVFWSAVTSAETWIIQELCGGQKKEIGPEKLIEVCRDNV